MLKIVIVLIASFILNSCNSKTNANDNHFMLSNTFETSENGIVYFSFNNGINWVNSSNGLPVNVSIGLDGIATSSKLLGVATKEHGVYLYNLKEKTWNAVATDQQIIKANLGAIAIIDSTIFVGTQFKGVFYTTNQGKHWKSLNNGLENIAIRRFCIFNKILYVCTNDGFYSLDPISNKWKLEFRQDSLQTNGATYYKGRFYLATNKGIFSQQANKSWSNTVPQFSMHNISSDENQLYAMTYNELLVASFDGKNWHSLQNGLPKMLYTFNLVNSGNILFAGQWDGIYKKTNAGTEWSMSSDGLPTKFAVTNLKVFQDILVISTSERKIKEGMTSEN